MTSVADKITHGVYVIAEIGINHGGNLAVAYEMIESAAQCGVDAVKLQLRNIDSLPADAKTKLRTDAHAFGRTEYEHRKALEFVIGEHRELAKFAHGLGLEYGVSTWDMQSTRDAAAIGLDWVKVPSAKCLDVAYLNTVSDLNLPIIVSSGMCSEKQIAGSIEHLTAYAPERELYLLQCTSAYPCEPRDVNLRVLSKWVNQSMHNVCGYGLSGHHRGIQIDAAAVALGARIIERHFTLDRTSKGSDHASSLEPDGLRRLARDCQVVYDALGESTKRALVCEEPAVRKLRPA